MSVDEVIGSNVHHLLWEKRIRQQIMLDALSVSRGTLHKKMRGEVAWFARDVEAAARVLGVSIGELYQVTREWLSWDPHLSASRLLTDPRWYQPLRTRFASALGWGSAANYSAWALAA